MAPKKQVYQFKVTLKDVKPPIWRRIQVPSSYSFWDLHVAIQDAMGWLDCHLHEFRIKVGYEDMKAWVESTKECPFDPEAFAPFSVKFWNPKERFDLAFR